jgi:hypothetical protein
MRCYLIKSLIISHLSALQIFYATKYRSWQSSPNAFYHKNGVTKVIVLRNGVAELCLERNPITWLTMQFEFDEIKSIAEQQRMKK